MVKSLGCRRDFDLSEKIFLNDFFRRFFGGFYLLRGHIESDGSQVYFLIALNAWENEEYA
jgi:hypothetical protein